MSLSPEEEHVAIGYEDGTLIFWSLEDILRSHQSGEKLSEEYKTSVTAPPRAMLWKEQKFFCCLENGSVYAGSMGSLEDEPCADGSRAFGVCQTNSAIAYSSLLASHTLTIKSGDQQAAVEIGMLLRSNVVSSLMHCSASLILSLS